jgi:hypothetical protein
MSCADVCVYAPQFYSWYIYHENEEDMGKAVSAAAYIDGKYY